MGLLEAILPIIGIILMMIGGYGILVSFMSPTNYNKDDRRKARTIGFCVFLFGVALVFSTSLFVVVDAGTAGVQNTFGVVNVNTLQPGLHLKNPFTSIIPMSTRTQKYMDYGTSDVATITALSHDGLETTMGIAVNYHLNPAKVAELYINVGTEYSGIAMVNPIHSVPRDMISKYDTKTLYSASQEGSTDRTMLERELFETITLRLNEVGVKDSITIEQVSIRNIKFDEAYTNSISSKMVTDTQILQKKLEVEKQRMEAERVAAEAEGTANKARIEAQGKADAARIEAQGVKDAADKIGLVSEQYLSYYYLKTMGDNPKAIYIPINSNGLPILKTV